jgi:N-acetylglucosamine malate deacetylase 2
MTVTSAAAFSTRPLPEGPVPQAASVLAVTSRPGQESEYLGGVLYAFRRTGANLGLLCLSRGEASPLNSTRYACLEAVRPWELQLAANVLGISSVMVASYPDGALDRQPHDELADRVLRAIRQHSADLLLVIAPEVGTSGDVAVAAAARAAARQAGIPVVASIAPQAPDAWMIDLGIEADTARAIQRAAAAAHESQSQELPHVLQRLDLLGGGEAVRWLVFPPPML